MDHFLLLLPWLKIKLGSMVIRGLNSPVIIYLANERSPLDFLSSLLYFSSYLRGARG